MSDEIQFEHRQPPQGWTENASDIATWLRSPVEATRFLAEEILNVSGNLSIWDAPDEDDVEAWIYKSNIVPGQLGDISVLLDHWRVRNA